MTDEDKTAAIPPVVVTVIGGTGAGSPLTTGTVGITPDHQPNLVAQVVPPVRAMLIRGLYLFFFSLSGSLVTEHSLKASALTALAAMGLGIVRDCVTIFGNLEKQFPLATGSV